MQPARGPQKPRRCDTNVLAVVAEVLFKSHDGEAGPNGGGDQCGDGRKRG